MSVRPKLSLDELVRGVLDGDRAILGRAISLVESRRADHQAKARALLSALMPHTGGAHRIGLTGVPGVGKSTLLDELGVRLTAQGLRVAVLAVDPSSTRTGGSILGDKTRMERLARDPMAFVRPSPTSGTLGGVASKTREVMLLCEAAGYDVVLIETVGVGQSELSVAQMTDVFVVLMLAGAGDELQGIKRGLMELADILAVNKADGDNAPKAKLAAATYRQALRYLHPPDAAWQPEVLTCSGLSGDGLDALWAAVLSHQSALKEAGEWEARRTNQQLQWLWSLVHEGLLRQLEDSPAVAARLPDIEARVRQGTLSPPDAAVQILEAFAS